MQFTTSSLTLAAAVLCSWSVSLARPSVTPDPYASADDSISGFVGQAVGFEGVVEEETAQDVPSHVLSAIDSIKSLIEEDIIPYLPPHASDAIDVASLDLKVYVLIGSVNNRLIDIFKAFGDGYEEALSDGYGHQLEDSDSSVLDDFGSSSSDSTLLLPDHQRPALGKTSSDEVGPPSPKTYHDLRRRVSEAHGEEEEEEESPRIQRDEDKSRKIKRDGDSPFLDDRECAGCGTEKRRSKRQAALTDLDVAQFALTLEHLENAFYKQAVSQWPLEVFTDAGLSASFYDQLKYITHDEEGHVVALEAIITAAGGNPVQACTYNFPMSTPQEFIKLASVVEGLGVSAYLGAAPALADKYYLTAAASILITESLHQGAERNAVGEIPMANVFGTPLPPNAVYTIAAGFIKSCPASNSPLPFKAYTTLALESGLPTASIPSPGPQIEVVPSASLNNSGTVYGTFVSGLSIIAVNIARVDGDQYFFEVPDGIGGGQSYFFLTSDDNGTISDANILAGPAILEITPNAPTFDLTIL